jgi:hypothetical protein
MLHRIDSPQYHPTRFKKQLKSTNVRLKAQIERQEWRGGAKVRKK